MIPGSSALPQRNALIAALTQAAPGILPTPGSSPGPHPNLGIPVTLLASTIGHAALLSDTPQKWASTIAMLQQNGINPEGYEDFEHGRATALKHAGVSSPQEDAE